MYKFVETNVEIGRIVFFINLIEIRRFIRNMSENIMFFEHGKDVHWHSVFGTVLNNSRSLIWSCPGAKTMIEKKVNKYEKMIIWEYEIIIT